MTPMEAELCKLMTNAWRYIQFATINQFYMVAMQHGTRISTGFFTAAATSIRGWPGSRGPGFAAGPCLIKDTMQLAAFSQNNFVLGHAAMLVNEGLPAFLVELAKQQCKLSELTAGILGMAFKAESDDNRDSLSYKLRRLLTLEARKVLCTDPFVADHRWCRWSRFCRRRTCCFSPRRMRCIATWKYRPARSSSTSGRA